MTKPSKPLRSFLIFSILSALYTLSMFHRASHAVIASDLARDLELDAKTQGILGGAFFYSFALLQIPMGPILDRIGPRSIIITSTLIGAVGAFLFGFGNAYPTALLGRILIGAGMASVLMGSLKVFTLKFPPNQFATLMGSIISIGTLGNILATSPLAYLTSTIGWRATFAVAGWITTLLSFLTFWILSGEMERSEIHPSSSGPQGEMKILQSFRLIFSSLTFWQIGTVAFFRFGVFMALQGL